MEPIKISSLPAHVIDFILSDEQKYNFNNSTEKDRQILDDAEIGILLNTFNMTDVSQLYNITESDITELMSQNAGESDETENGEEETSSNNTFSPDIRSRDTSRRELVSYDATAVSLYSPDNTLSAIYEKSSADEELQTFIESVAGEIQKIEDENYENGMTEENQITYKDENGNEKVIFIKQSVSMGGIFQKDGDSDGGDDDGDETNSRGNNDDDNDLNGGLHYRLIANSDNTKFAFQAHIDNTDQDFFANIMHDRTLNNGGKLGLTGSGRVTLDQNEFTASGGLALDFTSKDNKITAGALGHINYNSTSEGNTSEYEASGYANYNGVGGLSARITKTSGGLTMPFIGANLYGKTSFDNGVSMSGALSAEIGRLNMQVGDEELKLRIANITGRGNLTFNAGDNVSANVDLMAVYTRSCDIDSPDSPSRSFGTILRGSFRKDRTEVYLVGCAYKEFDSENPLLTGAATFGIQINDLVKKGIAGYVEGTVCNTNANPNPTSSINGIKVGARANF